MGQSPSVPTLTRRPSSRFSSCFSKPHPPPKPTPPLPQPKDQTTLENNNPNPTDQRDNTYEIPDECLAHVFQSLSSGDRKRCSLVCKRWLTVEGQSRQRLSLNAQAEIFPILPTLLDRFDSVTKLALRCDRRSISISDEALVLISLRCRNLTRLKLRGCREITDLGISAFARNCKTLRKLSCGSCVFGAKGLNAVFEYCCLLEEISIKRLKGINSTTTTYNNNINDTDDNENEEAIVAGKAGKSLRSICLKELYNGQIFGPLIAGCKSLRTLKLIRCLGEWDRVLEMMSSSNNGLSEIHLERIQVSDFGLAAIASCVGLEVLHLVKAPDCTNMGVASVAERCKLLRKVHIDGWRTNRIGDEGLSVLGRNCPNLQELVLIGVNPTRVSLEVIASNCKGLERLALCSSETIKDEEMACIAKCLALKKFCIKSCPISDNGLEALACGCPNLVKIKVKKCREVTREVVEWLRERRELLVVNLDADEIEPVDASASEAGGGQEEAVEIAAIETEVPPAEPSIWRSGSGHSSAFSARLSRLFGMKVAVCSFRRRWSSTGSNSNANQ